MIKTELQNDWIDGKIEMICRKYTKGFKEINVKNNFDTKIVFVKSKELVI
jgi:hypothetical protein